MTRSITPQDLYEIQIPSGASISPDGKHVLFTLQRVDKKTERKYTNIWVADVESGTSRQFTFGDHSDSSPTWSPDGQAIAFMSNRGDEDQSQVCLIPFGGGEARALTDLKGDFGYFEWSPDGSKIAFEFTKKDADELAMEEDEDRKKLGTVSRHFTRIWYKNDGEGFFSHERQHIWIVDVSSGESRQLTEDDDIDEHRPVWTPDGESIVCLSNGSYEPDFNPEATNLYVVPVEGGETRVLSLPEGEKGLHSISPDGRWVAYIGMKGRGDWWRNNDLWVVPLDGSTEPWALTEALNYCVGDETISDMGEGGTVPPTWSPDSRSIYYQASWHGDTTLRRVSLETSEEEPVIDDPGAVMTFSLNADGESVAYLSMSTYDPGQIRVRSLASGESAQVSQINSDLVSDFNLGHVEEVWFKGPDDNDLQGWIMTPPGFDSSRSYPCILYVHGGPWAQYGNIFFHEFQYLAAQGYVVGFSNPRGGLGYGEEHAKAIADNWGDRDFADVMAWADVLSELPYVDEDRMGIAGGSYGGYMTNWAIGHTDRFKAASSQRSVVNLVDFYGSTDGNWIWEEVFGGKPAWDSLDNYWRQSPLRYIKNAKTPTQVIHSEQDLRCPITQSEQLYAALKRQRVDSEFIIFPEESHGLSRGGRTDRRIVRLEAIAGWFDKYLKS